MSTPEDRSYTRDHEWIRIADGVATVGITAYAAEQLGDIVYADLPAAGDAVTVGRLMGEIESTKSVGEINAPLDGEVLESNQEVLDGPELVNEDPFERGWLVKIKPASDPVGLLTAAEYEALLAAEA
ncbi:MAG: glycine cleavage system protein GcvH [Pseudoclavibacter sp.]|nr:glycine cleavage system protein GcvH [Pseudoclavibacter sp.]